MHVQLDHLGEDDKKPQTVGDRIKGNMQEHADHIKTARDNFLVWLLSTITGWLVLLSVIAIVVLSFLWTPSAAIATVVGLWVIYGLGKLLLNIFN